MNILTPGCTILTEIPLVYRCPGQWAKPKAIPKTMIADRKHDASNVLAPRKTAVTLPEATTPQPCPLNATCGYGVGGGVTMPSGLGTSTTVAGIVPIASCAPGQIIRSTGTDWGCVTQSDTSGNLMVYHHPDQPDGHWAIILVLALVIIWMWVHGVMVVWFSVVKSRWPFPGAHPSMAFCKERWKWKFLGWPVFWFWKPGP